VSKILIYSNTAADGWVVDSSVADKVLAIKGGSNAYAVAGGSNAGTWTQPGHVLTEAEIPAHSHNIEDNTHSHAIKTYNNSGTGSSGIGLSTGFLQGTKNTEEGTHSHGCGVTGSSSSHNHGSTYRPAAAVGTLQYLNI
jgi:microcystin-dependent protein